MRKDVHPSFQFGKTTMHLRDYQIEASDAALAKGRGIVHHATGSGKTVTAAVTIQKICRRTIYFVPNRTLLAQTARGPGGDHTSRAHRSMRRRTMGAVQAARRMHGPDTLEEKGLAGRA